MSKGAQKEIAINIAVVGIPSSQNDGVGSGKSNLCDRFLHPDEDDYITDHPALISQQDYSNSVVNSTNFLYWGSKELNSSGSEEEGVASGGGNHCVLHLVEHTEFIDEGTARPFHCAQNYLKRVCNLKLVSKNKVAFMNYQQLSLPDEYPDVERFPEKYQVDSFIVCVDASVDFKEDSNHYKFLSKLLPDLQKTRKPYILACTKFDIATLETKQAISEFASKQKKYQPQVVEVSAVNNLNIQIVFSLAAHLSNLKHGIPKPKVSSYAEEKKIRDEKLALLEDKMKTLLKNIVKDFDQNIKDILALVVMTPEGKDYIRYFGSKSARSTIRRHLVSLRNALEEKRLKELQKQLKEALLHCIPIIKDHFATDEEAVAQLMQKLISHEKFSNFFFDEDAGNTEAQEVGGGALEKEMGVSGSSLLSLSRTGTWNTSAVLKGETTKIPMAFLTIKENVILLSDYVKAARKRAEDEVVLNRIQQAFNVNENKVLPGTSLDELLTVCGCVEDSASINDRTSLSKLHNAFMRKVEIRYGKDLQELFLEMPELFMNSTAIDEKDAILSSQEKMKSIEASLKNQEKFKVLDGRVQFRQNIMMKHNAMFVTNKGTLMEDPLQEPLSQKAFRLQDICPNTGESEDELENEDSSDLTWILDTNDSYFSLALVGESDGIKRLNQDLQNQCPSKDGIRIGHRQLYLHIELYSQEVFSSAEEHEIQLQGAIVYIDSVRTLDWFEAISTSYFLPDVARRKVQRYVGMPLVILSVGDTFTDDKSVEAKRLIKLSDKLQCGLLREVKSPVPARLLFPPAAKKLVDLFATCVDKRTSFLQQAFAPGFTEMSVTACALPGDTYPFDVALRPLTDQPVSWYHDSKRQLLQIYLNERHSFIHVSLQTCSILNSSVLKPKDKNLGQPQHGYIIFYLSTRRASFNSAKYVIQNILPEIPTALVAVPPSTRERGNPKLIHEGRMFANTRETIKFYNAESADWEVGVLNPFFLLCWDRRLSSSNLQKKQLTRQSISKRDLPAIPSSRLRCLSPEEATLPEGVQSNPNFKKQRHSVTFGDLPLPRIILPPKEGDVELPTRLGSDSEGEGSGQVEDRIDEKAGMVSIDLANGRTATVPLPSRRREQDMKNYQDDDVMYSQPLEGDQGKKRPPVSPIKPKWSQIAPQKPTSREVSSKLLIDSDYAEPINSLRKHTDAKLSNGASGSVENLKAPIVTQFTDNNSLPIYAEPIKPGNTSDTGNLSAEVAKQPPPTRPKPKNTSKTTSRSTKPNPPPRSDSLSDDPQPAKLPNSCPSSPSIQPHKQAGSPSFLGRLRKSSSKKEPPQPSSKSPKGKHNTLPPTEPPPPPSTDTTECIYALPVKNKKKQNVPAPDDNLYAIVRKDALVHQSSDSEDDAFVEDRDNDMPPPQVPQRTFSLDDEDDDVPELPPRNYSYSDFGSDEEDDNEDFSAAEYVKEICDTLVLTEGNSKDLTTLYNTLDQYQRIADVMKPRVKEREDNLYDTVGDAMGGKGQGTSVATAVTRPLRDSPVRDISPKEAKENLKSMRRAAKAYEKQRKIEEKRKKCEEELRKREEERQRKAALKARNRSKKNAKVKSPKRKRAPVQKKTHFGVALETTLSEESLLPLFVVKCIELIEEIGLTTEGIYRLSGKHDEIGQLHEMFDDNPNMDFSKLEFDVTTISSGLKAFFKLLPDPLISENIAQEILKALDLTGDKQYEELACCLLQMPKANLKILSFLCHHLKKITDLHETNKMTPSNLAIVFWPTLIRPPLMDLANPTKQLHWQKIMTMMIDRPACVPDPDLEGAD